MEHDIEENQQLVPNQVTIKKPPKNKQTITIFMTITSYILWFILSFLTSVLLLDLSGSLDLQKSFSITHQIANKTKELEQIPNTQDIDQLYNASEWDENTDEFYQGARPAQDEDDVNEKIEEKLQEKNLQETLTTDSQYDKVQFIQTNVIIKPLIDERNYDYFELPNGIRVVTIQTDQKPKITFINLQGYKQNKLYLNMKGFEIEFKETSTVYKKQLLNDEEIRKSIDNMYQQIADQSPKYYKQIKEESFLNLLGQFIDETSIFSNKYKRHDTLNLDPNLMVLFVEHNNDPHSIKDDIAQSDLVLLPPKDKQKQIPTKLIAKLGQVIKYQDQQDYYQLHFVYQIKKLQNYHSLEFIKYLSEQPLRKFVDELQGDIIYNSIPNEIYKISVRLQDSNQDYKVRELAFRMAKIQNNLFQYLQTQLFEDNKQTQYCQDMIKEYQQLQNLKFNYNFEYDYTRMAQNIYDGNINDMLIMDYKPEINLNNIIDTLDQLRQPDNLLIFVNDQEYQYDTVLTEAIKGSSQMDIEFLKDEHIDKQNSNLYYSTKQINEQTKQFIQQKDEQMKFDLKKMNKYIPYDLKLYDGKKNTKIPSTFVGITLDTPYNYQLQDFMNSQQSNLASQIEAGYQFKFEAQNKFRITLSGWTEHIIQVNQEILKLVNEGLSKKFVENPQNNYEYFNKYGLDDFITQNYKHSNQISSITTFIDGNADDKISQQIEDNINQELKNHITKKPNIEIIDLSSQLFIHRIQTQPQVLNTLYQIFMNYYQYGKRTLKEFSQISLFYNYINKQIKERKMMYILEFRKTFCVDGFIISKQTHNNLLEESNKADQFIKQSIENISKLKKKQFESLKQEVLDQYNHTQDQEAMMNFQFVDQQFTLEEFKQEIHKSHKEFKSFSELGKLKIFFTEEQLEEDIKSKTDLQNRKLNSFQC